MRRCGRRLWGTDGKLPEVGRVVLPAAEHEKCALWPTFFRKQFCQRGFA